MTDHTSIVKDADIFLIEKYLTDEQCTNLINLLNRDDMFSMYKLYFYDKNDDMIYSVPNHRKSYWLGDFAQSVQSPNNHVRINNKNILIPTDYVRPYQMPQEILDLKNKIENEFQCTFNSCLVGKYDSPKDKIGFHSDASVNLGTDPQIASVSLGHSRDFFIKSKDKKELKKTTLKNGDLLIMKNGANLNYLHSVPNDKTCNQENFRINLTFRNYTYHPEEMKIPSQPFL